jgi:phytoene/squalene synthetase
VQAGQVTEVREGAKQSPAIRAAQVALDRIVEERYFVFGRRLGLSRRRKVALAASMWVGSLLP